MSYICIKYWENYDVLCILCTENIVEQILRPTNQSKCLLSPFLELNVGIRLKQSIIILFVDDCVSI